MRPLTPSSTTEVIRAAAPGRTPAAGRRLGALLAAVAAASLAAVGAHAEKADRTKPMSVTSGGNNPDVVDLKNHSAVFTGNVVITQGTLEIHADRVEVSQDPDGNQLGFAYGSGGKPATFRQKRDGVDEFSEGEAQKIEYDSAANRVRFVGDAHLRMLQGTTITDQANSELITYDTASETIKLGSGHDRTTVIFTPKASSEPRSVEPLRLSTPASGPAR